MKILNLIAHAIKLPLAALLLLLGLTAIINPRYARTVLKNAVESARRKGDGQ